MAARKPKKAVRLTPAVPPRAQHITLPLPPPQNQMFAVVHGRMILTARARKFIAEAEEILEASDLAPYGPGVPVSVLIRVYRSKDGGDVDGGIKRLLDVLQGYAYLNDSQVLDYHVWRDDDWENPRVHAIICPAESI